MKGEPMNKRKLLIWGLRAWPVALIVGMIFLICGAKDGSIVIGALFIIAGAIASLCYAKDLSELPMQEKRRKHK